MEEINYRIDLPFPSFLQYVPSFNLAFVISEKHVYLTINTLFQVLEVLILTVRASSTLLNIILRKES